MIKILLSILGVMMVSGCAALFPASLSLQERLDYFPQENLPLKGDVTLRWNEWQIPMVEADFDEDVPFMLGLIHGHLRLGQIAFLKRMAAGRLSEIIGPYGRDIDHSIRLLAVGRASDEIWRTMSEEGRLWLSRFVGGLNFYQTHLEDHHDLPPTFSLFGFAAESFTPQDIITLSRLAAADVNWFVLLSILMWGGEHEEDFWKESIELYEKGGSLADMTGEFEDNHATQLLTSLLSSVGRVGSNSFALAPKRTVSGGAIIANDPHLGSNVPNFWLLGGIHSPSYHVVGFMMAGVPVMAMGRNQHVAWGGTNMRGLVSDLYDVSELVQRGEVREETSLIRTRFWFDDVVVLRHTDYGFIITDSPILGRKSGKPLALRWMGHENSDEISAFLAMARASNEDEFEQAFRGYQVPSLNILYATDEGFIGQLYGGRFPNRDEARRDIFPKDIDKDDWRDFHTSLTLPIMRNPERGFLVSGNDKPENIGDDQLGYFFAPKDRVRRMAQLIEEKDRLDLDDVRRILLDTTSLRASLLASYLSDALRKVGIEDDILRRWDGNYDKKSKGALRFELLLYHLAHGLYEDEDGKIPFWRQRWLTLSVSLRNDLESLPQDEQERLLRHSWVAAAADADGDDFQSWGDIHQLRVGHMLKNVPVLGSFFVEEIVPVSGSRSTLFKSGHGLVNDVHATNFGSQSRFVVDMSDMDANYAILIGGSDGWLGSANFNDQTSLWLEGEFIPLPLSEEGRIKAFPHVMTFSP